MNATHDGFILSNTAVASTPLLPEIRLHLATEITPLWHATEAWLDRQGLAPPFWAFAWAGGLALARHVLERPGTVMGRHVLDFAAGGGLVAIAAALAGARAVAAAEIDPLAQAAIRLNAVLNAVSVEPLAGDVVGLPMAGVEVVLAGDVWYERAMAERVLLWLRTLAAGGKTVLLGDPGRAYLPAGGLERLAVYSVPTTRELEDREIRETTVWCLLPD